MTLITIRERSAEGEGFHASLAFDNGPEFSAFVRDPFSPEEESRLEWYFEEHLRFPFADRVRAREAAESVQEYGEILFEQVFADRDAYAEYRDAVSQGIESVRVEVAGSPEFQRLHWEALKDPRLPRPLTLDAPMSRKNLRPTPVSAQSRPSPTLNVLVVTARPGGGRDVGYRTISRPLVEALRRAGLPVHVEILRPGTYQALSNHLQDVRSRHGAGFYHAIHLDVHGAVLTHDELQGGAETSRFLYRGRYGRGDLTHYAGYRAFLFLEGNRDGEADPVEAGELSALFTTHQIAVTILNACQSGKQVGAAETSLGARLMEAGVQRVLAMGYSVTVSAAEILVGELYARLFNGDELPEAIRRARLELHSYKERRAYFNQHIELEDWLLPVVYENRPQPLRIRPFSAGEAAAWYEREARKYEPPPTPYGFVGRDLDVLYIEKLLLTNRNVLLVRGMGGAGKTTLLGHLGAWWQTTRFVEHVFYFGWDKRAWTRAQIIREVAKHLYSPAEFHSRFETQSLDVQQKMLAATLRAERHVLILDNLESVTGAHMAVDNRLSPEEREALRRFLADLLGGRTLVLLGSRVDEEWLRPGTFEDNTYELPGLDPEAASLLAEKVLERHGATRFREDEGFRRLTKVLDGYPLAVSVVLANLSSQTPAEVLEALLRGGVDLHTGDGQSRTEDILLCIDYSHRNLSPDASEMLLCLAPFSLVFSKLLSRDYIALLREEPTLAHLPFDRWDELLEEAARWGLITLESSGIVYHLQPIFPYFLRMRLAEPSRASAREAIERCFLEFYNIVGRCGAQWLTSGKPEERTAGKVMLSLEYENLTAALTRALEAHASIIAPYAALTAFFNEEHRYSAGLELSRAVLAGLERYNANRLEGEAGYEMFAVLDDMASKQLMLKDYASARELYERVLALIPAVVAGDERERTHSELRVHHQLGRVAEQEGRFEDAKRSYRRAIELGHKVDGNNYDAAVHHHHLGVVAKREGKWAEARGHYENALRMAILHENLRIQAGIHLELGNVARETHGWNEARDRYQRAAEIYAQCRDDLALAGAYQGLGNVAQEEGEWDVARDVYLKSLEIRIEYDDRPGQGDIYHNLGMIACEQGELEESEQYLRKALEIADEVDDEPGMAKTYHQLGTVAAACTRWAEAESMYRASLQILEKFNDAHGRAGVHHELGLLVGAQEQWDEATRQHLLALAIYADSGDRLRQASMHQHLGIVAWMQENWILAEQHLRTAILMFSELDYSHAESIANHHLALLYENQERWEESIFHFRAHLEFVTRVEDRESGWPSLRGLARVWRATGLDNIPQILCEVLGGSPEESLTLLGLLSDEQSDFSPPARVQQGLD